METTTRRCDDELGLEGRQMSLKLPGWHPEEEQKWSRHCGDDVKIDGVQGRCPEERIRPLTEYMTARLVGVSVSLARQQSAKTGSDTLGSDSPTSSCTSECTPQKEWPQSSSLGSEATSKQMEQSIATLFLASSNSTRSMSERHAGHRWLDSPWEATWLSMQLWQNE